MGGLSDGLALDVAELEQLLESATRPHVKQILQQKVSETKSKLWEQKRNEELVLRRRQGEVIDDITDDMDVLKGERAAPSGSQATAAAPATSTGGDHNLKWTDITMYEIKEGTGYNDPKVVVDLRLKGVEKVPAENISTEFTRMSMDVKIKDLDGVNYRFRRTALQHDIVASSSSHSVKKNHVLVSMQKVEGKMGYETWNDIGGRKKSEDAKQAGGEKKSNNPQDSLLGMMKDMYDEGDDQMKKIIGEAMSKAYRPGGPKQEDIDNIGKFDMPEMGGM
eukprot:g5835.t1